MTVGTDQRALDALCVNTIRTLSMDAVQRANSGHPGTPMALAPIAYLLYTRVMRHTPEQPDWPDRDRFVLSCGPRVDAPVLDAVPHRLRPHARRDRALPPARLPYRRTPRVRARRRHRGDHGPARAGHLHVPSASRWPSACWPRASTTTGTRRSTTAPSPSRATATWRRAIASEASSLAGHLGLGSLIALLRRQPHLDRGRHELAFTEDVGARYEAYGWHVQNLGEDLALDTIEAAVTTAAIDVEDRPSLIIVRTHIAPGIPEQAGHRRRPWLTAGRGGGAPHQARSTAGPSPSRSSCPRPRSTTSAQCVEPRARSWRPTGPSALEAYRAAFPNEAAEFERMLAPAAPRRLGRRPPALRGRPDDRDPQGLAGGDPVGGRRGARAGRRLGRPRALDAHADRRRRQRRGRHLRAAATCTSASASTAWARSSTA